MKNQTFFVFKLILNYTMKHIHMFIEFYFNELFLLFVLKIGLYFRLGYLSDLFSNLRRDSLCDKKHFFMYLFGGHFFQK